MKRRDRTLAGGRDAGHLRGDRHRLSDPASAVFAPVIEILGVIGLPEGSRNVVERTFGEDLESARELNRVLQEAFLEEAVFQADHFLGLQTF